MNHLLLLLLLGATPDRPATNAFVDPARGQAVASARILRGHAIAFEAQANRYPAQPVTNAGYVFQPDPRPSATAMRDADGRTIHLQEFP